MSEHSVESRVKRLLADQFGVVTVQIKNDTRLCDDLGADSLDLVEIAMMVEDEFCLEIPNEGEGWTTIQDVINEVEAGGFS